MCTSIIHGADWIDTMGELRELVPVEQWVYDPAFEHEHYADGCCLCPLDVRATLERGGFKAKPMDGGLAYIIQRKESHDTG